MTDRDRQILIFGGILAGVILLYLVVLRPVSRAVDELDTRVQDRTIALNDAKRLADELKALKATIPQGADSVNLPSYVEGLAKQAELQKNIEYMKPGKGVQKGSVKRNTVEVKLVRVNLKQLTNLLFQVERGGRYPLKVDEIHIKKRFDAPELLDVTFEVYQG